MSFEEFIRQHSGDDPVKLLLSRDKWPDIDVALAASTISGRRALAKKLPSWMEHEGLQFPDKLCTEQCSGESASTYKAALALRICGHHGNIADLTGGLGADSAAFSKAGFNVLHNEMNPVLSASVKHNFELMGIKHISFSCMELVPGKLGEILGDFSPEIIFLDPARRSSDGSGKKVFRLSECSPDVIALRDELLERSPHLLLKLSPMADISQICTELGPCCREIHAVESGGECKELLIWMDRQWNGGWTVTGADADSGNALEFSPEREKDAAWLPFSGQWQGRFLFEPGKALMKTGMYKQMSSHFAIEKLERNTHLYIFDSPEPCATMETLPFSIGKCFRIVDCIPFSARAISEVGRRYPMCEVTARNLPISSDALRSKMRVKGGAAVHIFAAMTVHGKMMFVTEPVLTT